MPVSAAFVFKKQNKLALDCTLQCHGFKKNIATELDHDLTREKVLTMEIWVIEV